VGIDFDNLDGRRGYSPWRSYGQSKLANLLFAKQLAKRLKKSGQTANALHPGVIRTNLGRHMNPVARIGMAIAEPLFFKSIPEGAATQCYLATHPALKDVSGHYFSDCNLARPHHRRVDDALAERLWLVSEQIVAQLLSTAQDESP
jgi:WW domain-containing oxidoreductase